ncbi:Hypothetical predicted protein [Pelobates cultripes]|uniref:Uncharacterized protein n=1 Tax=Pelobates cultripes TaxID=61616 RepID=A0AAD1WWN8_PELCU|nr:Hypothetical predicted protein [Pelobates cultripes]
MHIFTAELNLVKTEVQAVAARVQATEEDVQDLNQGMTTLNYSVQQLGALHASLSTRVDQLDDRGRQRNIKIRGIADSLTPDEIPHFIRRLAVTILDLLALSL